MNKILICLSFIFLSVTCQPAGGGQPPGGSGPPSGEGGASQASPTGTICKTDGSSNNAAIIVQATSVTFATNNCPNHTWGPKINPNDAIVQSISATFNRNPVKADKPLNVGINGTPTMGPVGIALNGIVIYGPADADKQDAYMNESQTFDACDSHADMRGIYHYHTQADCAIQTYSNAGTSDKHSPIFAIMADGIPLFGWRGAGGKAPTDLDTCGGHIGSGTDEYPFYHYHTTNPDVPQYPYTINCLVGCVNSKAGIMASTNVGASCQAASDQTGFGQTAGDAIWKLYEETKPSTTANTLEAFNTQEETINSSSSTNLVSVIAFAVILLISF